MSRFPQRSGASDESRIRPPSPTPPDHEIHTNGGRMIPKRPINNVIPRHRRVISDVSLRKSQEPIPELFLGAPLVQDNFDERRTLQTQWAEALKKVQALGNHSSRWSGVATDLYRPQKSMPSQASTRTLDQWNYYPGPSVKSIPENQTATGTDRRRKSQGEPRFCRNGSVSSRSENLDPDQTGKSQAGEANFSSSSNLMKGFRSKSVTTTRLETLDPASTDQTWESQAGEADISSSSNLMNGYRSKSCVTTRLEKLDAASTDQTWTSQVGEAFSSSSNLMKGCRPSKSCVTTRLEDLDPASTDQTWKSQAGAASFSSSSNLMKAGCGSKSVTARIENPEPASTTDWPRKSQVGEAPERVHRTQSHRYGTGMKVTPDTRVLSKAVSMREGGAHADAVLEMAAAYAPDASVCGVPLTLQCASCGRSLGVIVQGNPGVDIAFCQACRPSEGQWRRKKKSGIVRFCRRILRLDRKTS